MSGSESDMTRGAAHCGGDNALSSHSRIVVYMQNASLLHLRFRPPKKTLHASNSIISPHPFRISLQAVKPVIGRGPEEELRRRVA